MSTDFWGQFFGALCGVILGEFIVALYQKLTSRRRIAKLRKEWKKLIADGTIKEVHIL